MVLPPKIWEQRIKTTVKEGIKKKKETGKPLTREEAKQYLTPTPPVKPMVKPVVPLVDEPADGPVAEEVDRSAVEAGEYVYSHADPSKQKQLLHYLRYPKYGGVVPPHLREHMIKYASKEAYESLTPEEHITFYKQYGTFGTTGKSWEEVKREDPALELRVRGGQVETYLDTEKWYQKRYKGADPFLSGVAKFSFGVTRAFDPNMWVSVAMGDFPQYRAMTEYRMFKQYGVGTKDVDLFKYYTGEGLLLSPGYVNVVYPFSMGAGLGLAFKGVGLAARGTAGGLGKVLSHFGSKAPWVAGGVMSGLVGADIGLSFAESPRKGVTRSLGHSMRFISAGAGAYTVLHPSTPFVKRHMIVIEKSGDMPTLVGVRKYFTILGKPVYYGKPVYGFEKPGLSMSPPPSWEPNLGRVPSSIHDIPIPMSKSLQLSMFRTYDSSGAVSKIYMGVGQEWKPYTPLVFPPSTGVLPKPVLYRSYETHFFFVAFIPKPIVSVTHKPVFLKPITLKDNIKDMGKLFSDHEKQLDSMGGQIQQGGLKTIQLLKQEKIVVPKQILAQDQVSMRHPLFGTQQLKIVQKSQVSMKHPLYGTKQAALLDWVSISKAALIPMYAQESLSGSLLAHKPVSAFESVSVSVSASIQASLQAQAQDFAYVPEHALVYDFDYGLYPFKPIIAPPEKSVPHFDEKPPSKPPRTPGFPVLPSDRKDKKGFVLGQGFGVEVKERYIFHGVKVKPERFKRVDDHPLSKGDALSLGSHLVDNSAAASFRIVAVKGKPKELKLNVGSFNRNKFYKKGDIFIEKTIHRIDSPGEFEGITAQGLLARMKGSRKSRVVKKKQTFFMPGFDFDKQMLKLMDWRF